MQAGQKVKAYELVAEIGRGGMGEVWKARDTRLDRFVAIKFVQSKFSDRFEGEARAIAALNHAKYLYAPRHRAGLPDHGVCGGPADLGTAAP